MKKSVIFLFLLVAAVAATAQYQLPNAGFEQWDGGNTSEPTHWNTFSSSDGSYATLASSNHHYRRNGGRPGTAGSHFLTLYTQSILGIKANGNMTTGRIHAGSMTATSSENYNYTQRSNADHSLPFTGTPDSMYVWVSYYAADAGSQAQVSAILHGDNDFRAPNQEGDASLYCAKAVARFGRTTSSAHSYQWQQMKVPFVYDGNAAPRYMLVNLTTNATPGGGDGNDSLSIDDIEFVYSAWLTGISVGGQPIEGFQKGRFDYTLHVDDASLLADGSVTVTTEASDATVGIERMAVDTIPESALFVITVTAEDGVTVRTYTVRLIHGEPGPVGIDSPVAPASLRVYPNPTTDHVTVQAEGLVLLTDLQGRELLRRTVHGSARLDLHTLPAGTYLLRCGQATRRLVKK